MTSRLQVRKFGGWGTLLHGGCVVYNSNWYGERNRLPYTHLCLMSGFRRSSRHTNTIWRTVRREMVFFIYIYEEVVSGPYSCMYFVRTWTESRVMVHIGPGRLTVDWTSRIHFWHTINDTWYSKSLTIVSFLVEYMSEGTRNRPGKFTLGLQ